MQIDWLSFTYGFAAGAILTNIIQIVDSFFKHKTALKQKRIIESEIKDLQKTIEKSKTEIKEEIKKMEKK